MSRSWLTGVLDRFAPSPNDAEEPPRAETQGDTELPDAPDVDIMRCVNLSRGTVVAQRVVWTTGAAKRRGLLGRDALGMHEGMYLVPCQWIHMFGMRFPIDVAFLAGDGRVLAVHHNLQPNRLSRPVLRAEGALELAAGALRISQTVVGDRLELRDP
jgi:uncharacterized membrane protein (UPF0127 family)